MNKKPYSTTSSVSCVDPQLLVVDILMPKGLLKSHHDTQESTEHNSLLDTRPQIEMLGDLILNQAEGGYASLPYQ